MCLFLTLNPNPASVGPGSCARIPNIYMWGVFYLGILRYPISSTIISSFWGIVFYIRNMILLGSTTKETLLMSFNLDFLV